MKRAILFFMAAAFSISCAQQGGAPGPDSADAAAHAAEVEAWFADREARLRAPEGWLSLTGLFWLQEGSNTIGSAVDNDITLPPDWPAVTATLEVEGSSVSLSSVDPKVSVDGISYANPGPVTTDQDSSPTRFVHETSLFFVVSREQGLGIRLKNSEAPTRLDFAGINRYPTDQSWRIEARFEPYNPPRSVEVPNATGIVSTEGNPGAVVFEHEGSQYRIDAIGEVSGELWLIFADDTNGDETYGSGRYLYTDEPDADGKVIVDFNYAYSPPCAFTAFATCPLPPSRNQLKLSITAGEKAPLKQKE